MKKNIKLILVFTIMAFIYNPYLTNYVFANGMIEQDNNFIEERYTYIKYANSELSITNGNAMIYSNMRSKTGINKSLITSRLQKKVNGSWQTIEAWTASKQGILCELNKSIAVSKGYEYRVFSTVKAYKGSKSESIAVYSKIVKY